MLEVEVSELESLSTRFDSYIQAMQDINFPDPVDAWQTEIVDGMLINQHRATFMKSLIDAMLAYRQGIDFTGYLDLAEQHLTEAQVVITRRRENTWDPQGDRLFIENTNSTIYQFGYLHRVSDLCYWQREYTQAQMLFLIPTRRHPDADYNCKRVSTRSGNRTSLRLASTQTSSMVPSTRTLSSFL